MKRWIVSGLLIAVGLLNVAPAFVFFAPQRSEALYGIALTDANMAVVMRHRAIMLGLLGAAMIYAAFRRDVVVPVVVAALVGKAAFLLLVYSIAGTGAELKSVAMFDLVAVACLGAVLGVHLYGSK